MITKTLSEWLDWLTQLHPTEIELGLQRCTAVAERLHLIPSDFPIITVAGTNGKGSSVHLLDAILTQAGYRCGRYTSPHLIRYNERISIARQLVDDATLCDAFTTVEQARGEISLTHFEFSTIAAMWIFQQQSVDVAVLEVGLGGRLDAVNMFNPTLSLITRIGIDHTAWLGESRDQIALEKAGIMRAHQPAVTSDIDPPATLLAKAAELATPLFCIKRDFDYEKAENSWYWWCNRQHLNNLPLPSLAGDFQLANAAGVLMTIELLQSHLPVPVEAIYNGLTQVTLPGRLQIIPGRITRILDVAHNPQSATALHNALQMIACAGQLHALVSCLADKDLLGIFTALQAAPIVSWHIAPLAVPRAASLEALETALQTTGVTAIKRHADVSTAYHSLLETLPSGDCLLVFGSFYTVAAVLVESEER